MADTMNALEVQRSLSKCIRTNTDVIWELAFNDFFQCLYSVDRFLGKFKQKHGLADKFRCKSQANEIGELRARFKNGKQDIKVDHEEKEDK